MNPGDRRPSRLHTLVLGLYPRSVRDRYAPELRELLETSAHPARDLFDVARSGVRERVTAWPRWLAACAKRESAEGPQAWILSSTATVAAQGAPLAVFTTVPWAAALPGIGAGLLLTRRGAGPWPALLVCWGVLSIYQLPLLLEPVGALGRTPGLVSAVALGMAASLLAPWLRVRPGRRGKAAVATLGVLALPPLATTLFAVLGHLTNPWQSYWSAISLRAPAETGAALGYYPALYTCCAFLLVGSTMIGAWPALARWRERPHSRVGRPGHRGHNLYAGDGPNNTAATARNASDGSCAPTARVKLPPL